MNKIIEIGNLVDVIGVDVSDVMESIEDNDVTFAAMYDLLKVANFFYRKQLPANWTLIDVSLGTDMYDETRVIYRLSNEVNTVSVFYYDNGIIELHDYETEINSESGEYEAFNNINNRNIDELLKAYEEALEEYNN